MVFLSLAALLGSKKGSTSARIIGLREVLSTPVSDPAFEHVLSSLPSNLRRRRNSRPSNLCSAHAALLSGPLVEIIDMLIYELHVRLAHLYQFPRVHLSHETQTYLYQTLRPYRIYFRKEPSYDADRNFECESALGTTCLACKLSLFFRDEAAVKALAVCAKSRRQRGSKWPLLLDWLERGKGEDWEKQWTRDGENVRRDRKKAQLWRRRGGENEEEENGDPDLAATDKGKSKEENLEEEEDLDEEPGNENSRFQAWVCEQKERAARFSAERNPTGQGSAYVEPDIRPSPFTDSNDYHSGNEGEPPPDLVDTAGNRSDHDQERETEEDEDKKWQARVMAYETLTDLQASPSVVDQIRPSEYQPAEWRRRRH